MWLYYKVPFDLLHYDRFYRSRLWNICCAVKMPVYGPSIVQACLGLSAEPPFTLCDWCQLFSI